ncbi:hypothetical protein SLS60_000228 [Paraconiothyrium brasiliense]|uniref:Uncharacterized protein n=1 Tax=Paraconiothyrium brasiliense TaxID=300254 RepID=A0ABR3S5M1_9PLEO
MIGRPTFRYTPGSRITMAPLPFETSPATAEWDRTITHEDYTKILQGYRPQQMEDKCTVVADAPEDAQGNTILHVYFGWKPREEISLEIATGDPNKTDAKDWATIVTISWKVEHPGGLTTSEEEAKTTAINLCNNLLGCELEEEDGSGSEDEGKDED